MLRLHRDWPFSAVWRAARSERRLPVEFLGNSPYSICADAFVRLM
jgi:hypothetical protein